MSVSSESELSGEGDWQDVESDHEAINVVSLFDAKTFSSAGDMLKYCKEHHDFDLVAVISRLKLDFHGSIKLVNFIRSNVKAGQPVLPSDISVDDFADEKYLKPVLENDALLFTLDEILEEQEYHETGAAQASGDALAIKNKELEAELEALHSQFANYRLAVEQTLDKRWGDESEPGPLAGSEKKDNSNYYFESYAEHEIHETMLKDTVRTNAYRDFIYDNKGIFKDKVVLDIGCGTGILSMFAAKAGARQVIAVDKSEIISKAIENIFNNGLSSIITCLKGAIEEVVLPVKQVDIIISEWMGYCLLYEAMLPSVLYARDKYLKPDGILAPSSATIWMAPVADHEYVADHISFWRDVYGFDMKAMQAGIYDECRIQTMPEKSLCGEPYPFKVLDLHTVKVEELQFTANWESKISRDIDEMDGFIIWFDNFFATSRSDPMPEPTCTPEQWVKRKGGNVAFTTGPQSTETHWRQGLLLVPPSEDLSQISAGTKITGDIRFKAAEDNARALLLVINWTIGDRKNTGRSWELK